MLGVSIFTIFLLDIRNVPKVWDTLIFTLLLFLILGSFHTYLFFVVFGIKIFMSFICPEYINGEFRYRIYN